MANEAEGTLFLKPVKVEPGPATVGDACLILLHPPGPGLGARTPLTRDEYVIGRGPENDIVAERDSVSRRHARLFRSDTEGWCLEDLGSTNGSFVNDMRIQRQPLADGNQLRIGDVIYKFLVGANVEAAYHEEIYRLAILDGLTGVPQQAILPRIPGARAGFVPATWASAHAGHVRHRPLQGAQRHSRASRRRSRPEDAVLPDPATNAA